MIYLFSQFLSNVLSYNSKENGLHHEREKDKDGEEEDS